MNQQNITARFAQCQLVIFETNEYQLCEIRKSPGNTDTQKKQTK
jgi:hypothetical protein